MAERTDTRRAILDEAERLWLHQGYNGFSYQHIAKALGVKPAAIHYHFPAKQDLGVALVERMRRRFARWAERQALAGGDFWHQLEAYVRIHEAYLEDEQKVCPSGILDAEFHTISEPMRTAARALTQEMYAWLTATLRAGRERGEVGFRGEPEGVAAVVGATVQGALQISRAVGVRAFRHTIDHLELQLRRCEPAALERLPATSDGSDTTDGTAADGH